MDRYRIIFYKIGDIWETALEKYKIPNYNNAAGSWEKKDIINSANYMSMLKEQASRGWIDIMNKQQSFN